MQDRAARRLPRSPLRSTALLAAAGSAVAVVSFQPAMANHSWGTYHWSRVTTLAIPLDDNVGFAWDSYLRSAAIDWSASPQIDAVVSAGRSSPATCAPVYGRVEVCNASYGSTGWLGLGQVWTSGGHVVQGTAKLNDTYFNQPQYNTPSWRRSVMCQEIGHTFGLDHQDINTTNLNLGSCMDYTRDPSGTRGTNGPLSNERPNAHDFSQLSLIYTHLDSTQLSSTKPSGTTVTTTSGPQGREAALLSRPLGHVQAEWGRAIRNDARGRPRLFVRDLGGGLEVTTFVLWAEEADPELGEHEH
ncbi:MAG TPA: hypothetical protein VFS45_05115 [Sphingomicrobium sp.]|nr:hypothetical protein [Sphingomicrobium sp.]